MKGFSWRFVEGNLVIYTLVYTHWLPSLCVSERLLMKKKMMMMMKMMNLYILQ